ncbi:MAG: HNH endonuclease [Candidatus Thorarchaeota archaeon]|nr:HNH endonuclease [Candidatus Thorarchaeota archaeon]
MSFWWEEKPKKKKRTLGIRDKQILWERAGHKCEACGKEITYPEMQAGHKIAASKGGDATLRNCVSLCYKCNKLQGTDSWKTFLRKLGKQGSVSSGVKQTLKGLTLPKLKFLAKKHKIKVKGRIEEGLFEDRELPPTKAQYVTALAKRLTEKDIESNLKEFTEKPKKKRKKSSDSFW